ncbi:MULTISPECIES: hypothetical protein [unclassified Streptomyces]|uniref:hypothetical protein n=1 Tax=unclassified Streptomyces TaxID=2593676 RepID=UPI002E79C3A2|nr:MULTISPECIES: hypothetical protein [unclassified Streptomyces]MEE1766038.1 hypothetical protein [Streptomyces sp. SP18BB07]MEE1834816.1 hypothetical protein [Streptomyces sp. SP17KL33]
MWWVKARRAHTVLAGSLAGFFVLILTFRNGTVTLPSLTISSGLVPLALLAPVPLVSGLLLCLESRLAGPEATAVRGVEKLDAALIVGVMAVTVVMGGLTGLALDSPPTVTTGRNALFLTGLALCARPVMGLPAVMVPVAWLVTTILCGFRATNDPRPWTIIAEPITAPHAAAGAALVFLVGLIIQLRTSRTPRT